MGAPHAAPSDELDGQRSHYEERLSRLRGQNQQIINETVALRAKFRKSLRLLNVYQAKLVQTAEAPGARAEAGAGLEACAPSAAGGARDSDAPPDARGCGSRAEIGAGARALAAPPKAAPSAQQAQLSSPGRPGMALGSIKLTPAPAPYDTPPRSEEGGAQRRAELGAQPKPQPRPRVEPLPPRSSPSAEQLQQRALEARRALDERSRAYAAWGAAALPPARSDATASAAAARPEAGQSGTQLLAASAALSTGSCAKGPSAPPASALHEIGEVGCAALGSRGGKATGDGGAAGAADEAGGMSTPPARLAAPPSAPGETSGAAGPLMRAHARAEAGGRAADGAEPPQLPEEPPPFEPRTTRLARSPTDAPSALPSPGSAPAAPLAMASPPSGAAAPGGGRAEGAARARAAAGRQVPSPGPERDELRPSPAAAVPAPADLAASRAQSCAPAACEREALPPQPRPPLPLPSCAVASRPSAECGRHSSGRDDPLGEQLPLRRPRGAPTAADPPPARQQPQGLAARAECGGGAALGRSASAERELAGGRDEQGESRSDTASLFELIEALNGPRGGRGGVGLGAEEEEAGPLGGAQPLRALVDLIADLEEGQAGGGQGARRAWRGARAQRRAREGAAEWAADGEPLRSAREHSARGGARLARASERAQADRVGESSPGRVHYWSGEGRAAPWDAGDVPEPHGAGCGHGFSSAPSALGASSLRPWR